MSAKSTYTLAEAAAETGISLRFIRNGCRAGTIEHTPRGAGTKRVHRVLTGEQLAKLKQSQARGVTVVPEPAAPIDELAAARAATRAIQRGRTGHRRVA